MLAGQGILWRCSKALQGSDDPLGFIQRCSEALLALTCNREQRQVLLTAFEAVCCCVSPLSTPVQFLKCGCSLGAVGSCWELFGGIAG